MSRRAWAAAARGRSSRLSAVSLVGLHHAGMYVSDLQRSIAFYGEAFGLEVAERLRFGEEDIVFLSVGAGRLELIHAAGVASRGTGIVDHVAFAVDDLDSLVESLR